MGGRLCVGKELSKRAPVPPLITEETFELAQARLRENAHFSTLLHTPHQGAEPAARHTRLPRNPDGKRCTSRPVRADEIDPLVWAEVRRLLEHPELVQAEIDRRLTALRAEHPAARRRDALERDLARASAAGERLIEAYQEQLVSLNELRARMPALRKRQTALQAQLDSLGAELHDAESYLKLADTLEGFLARLTDGLDHLEITEQQRILRLAVREVLIGGNDATITIRHTIPTPKGPDDPSYLLRGSSLVASSWSQPNGPPQIFSLSHVIEAWRMGIPGMRVGGRRELIVPARLADGSRGRPPALPPDAALVFVVDLHGVT